MSAAANPASRPEAAPARAQVDSVVPVYVWQLPVRLTHWLIALSLLVLAVTGFYMGRPFVSVPGQAREHFVTGYFRAVHFYAAIVFTAALVARLIWMFTGNRYARWNQFVPTSMARLRAALKMIRFYAFVDRRAAEGVGHNALAGATYVFVYALLLLQVATGLALYSVSADVDSPLRVFAFLQGVFGGPQLARWIHHVTMWLLIGFAAHHVMAVFMWSVMARTGIVDSMISGFKFLRRDKLREERP